jgi:hypothetical protein
MYASASAPKEIAPVSDRIVSHGPVAHSGLR